MHRLLLHDIMIIQGQDEVFILNTYCGDMDPGKKRGGC